MNSWWKTEQDASLVCQKWLSFDEVWIDPWVSLLSHGKAVGKFFFQKKPRWGWWIVARVLILNIIQKICFIFYSLIAYIWQAKRVAQLVSCFVGNHKVPGSNPWRTILFFLTTCLFHFFTKLHQFIWSTKTSHLEMIFCTLVI